MPLYKRVHGEQVEMSAKEETDHLAQQATHVAEEVAMDREKKRRKLIAHEEKKVLDAQIAAEKVVINDMDDAELDVAIAEIT